MAKIVLNFEGGSVTYNEGGPYVGKDGSNKIADPSIKISGVSSWGTIDPSAFGAMVKKVVENKDLCQKLGVSFTSK